MKPAVACAIAAVGTYLLTPLAIRVAMRTAFMDKPVGYKGHKRATPYLGGSAIMLGLLIALAISGGITTHYLPLVLCAVGVWLMGTADDKYNLPILLRVCVEAGAGVALARTGLGWTVFHQGLCDTLLSAFWVVGVMNAFNLMDNMDGASATVVCISSLGAGTLAMISGRSELAPICFATAGACAGFLPYNLAKPARIFMGDGGSLPMGLIVAASAMTAVNREYFGPSGVVIGAMLTGVVIFDTTMVSISRSRAGRSVLQGGRDHTTHRLNKQLGSPRRVALTLATTQIVLCGATIGVAQAGVGWVLAAGGLGILAGAVMIWQFETSPWFKVTQAKSDGFATADGGGSDGIAEPGAKGATAHQPALHAR
jgi:UDP-GlcNAc:undecaprenyl-phosphate/decaprenyl-phosphate GlcNAc-1-phosphate transferase